MYKITIAAFISNKSDWNDLNVHFKRVRAILTAKPLQRAPNKNFHKGTGYKICIDLIKLFNYCFNANRKTHYFDYCGLYISFCRALAHFKPSKVLIFSDYLRIVRKILFSIGTKRTSVLMLRLN